jgi:hypothetical protein
MPADTVVDVGQTIIVYQVVQCDRSARAQLQCSKAPPKTRGTTAKVPGTEPATRTASQGDASKPAEDAKDQSGGGGGGGGDDDSKDAHAGGGGDEPVASPDDVR